MRSPLFLSSGSQVSFTRQMPSHSGGKEFLEQVKAGTMIFDVYPHLENDLLILHQPEHKDLPELERMVRDKEVYRWEPSYLPELLSGSCEKFICHDCGLLFRTAQGIILGVYTQARPEQFIGIAELYGYVAARNKISLGYRLSRESWHRGIASSVVALLKDYILNELKLTRITAHVRQENQASARCLIKNGFVPRRAVHEEDWGLPEKVWANKYVIYPEEDGVL